MFGISLNAHAKARWVRVKVGAVCVCEWGEGLGDVGCVVRVRRAWDVGCGVR